MNCDVYPIIKGSYLASEGYHPRLVQEAQLNYAWKQGPKVGLNDFLSIHMHIMHISQLIMLRDIIPTGTTKVKKSP